MNVMVQYRGVANRLYHNDIECVDSTQPGRICFAPKDERQKEVMEALVKPNQTVRFEASWTQVALNFEPQPPQADARKLVFRAQTTSDRIPLEQMVAHDQAKIFEAGWTEGKLIFTLPDGADVEADPIRVEKARLRALSMNALKTESAERGVKWDNNASPDTMISRIAEAALTAKV